ncbi:MAG: hypothetical protein ACSHXL_01130 [Bacteroidota bacterium]
MKETKKSNVILFILLLISVSLQAQDCSSLRQPNETYGDGDTFVSWCNMQNPTAYTDCMCEQEKSQKVSAIEQQNHQKQALSKSTEANKKFTEAYNIVTQAIVNNDGSKLNDAKNLYLQSIELCNEGKSYIAQAFDGVDNSYDRLISLYIKQYDKQIAWATAGIESITYHEKSINLKKEQKSSAKNTNNISAKNDWKVKIESQKQTPSISENTSSHTPNQIPKQTYCSEWTTISGTCLDIRGKGGLEYQKCYLKETNTHVIFQITLRPTQTGIDCSFYKKGMKIYAGENATVKMDCFDFNKTGYVTEVNVEKHGKYHEWDSDKKAFYMTLDKKYKPYAGSLFIECLF